jgi:hypothetical protein
MRTLMLAAITVALPFVARADLIDDFLTVHYEGTVNASYGLGGVGSACVDCPYDIGDHVSGTLLVDLRRAPPDTAPEAFIGKYDSLERLPHRPAFVTGHAPDRADTADRVQVFDNNDGEDFFDVVDYSAGTARRSDGRNSYDQDSVFVSAASLSFDFTHGDGIVQDFDLSTQLAGGQMAQNGQISFLRQLLEDPAAAIGGTVFFVMSRFSVKPGRCSF